MWSWPSWQSLWREALDSLLLSEVELGRDMLILPGVRTTSVPKDSRRCTIMYTHIRSDQTTAPT